MKSQHSYSPSEAALWDGYYTSRWDGKGLLFRSRLSIALDMIGDLVRPGDGGIADIGCGTGRLTVELVKRGFHVSAFDCSMEMIKLTDRHLRENRVSAGAVTLTHADLNNYNFADGEFAAVCALGCLEFLADFSNAVRVIGKTVRPGGFFILSMPNLSSPFVWPERLARLALQAVRSRHLLTRHHPVIYDRVRRIMGNNGFLPVDRRFTFPASFVGQLAFPPALVLCLMARMRRYPLAAYMSNTWIAVFRKNGPVGL